MNRFITNHWFGLAVVALVFLLFASRVASGQNLVPDRSPTHLSGYLTCAETEDGARYCPFRLHYAELEKNRTYMIRMESSDLDTKLVLEDLFGRVLATDVDDYDALYGVIVFRPAETGRYRLIADAMTPMEGYYSITIRELPSVLSVEDALHSTDLPVNDSLERAYDVTMTAGRRYIIDMESKEFTSFVRLLNVNGAVVSFQDECGAMGNARIVFEPFETATYRIVAAASEERATGAFRLSVCEE